MTAPGRWLLSFGAAVVVVAFWAQEAWAYVDPATGSFVLQSLIAGVVGGVFVLRMAWKGLRDRIGRGVVVDRDDRQSDRTAH